MCNGLTQNTLAQSANRKTAFADSYKDSAEPKLPSAQKTCQTRFRPTPTCVNVAHLRFWTGQMNWASKGEDLLVECHGTTARARCNECSEVYSKEHYFKNATPPKCRCGGPIRPDIVLFGEALPDRFQKLSKEDFQSVAWANFELLMTC